MIAASDISLSFSGKKLFEDVNIKFTEGNCYGIIGANGAGKSTFLKILSKEIEATAGEIIIPKNQRVAVLKQNHFEYNDSSVIDTLIMGHSRLYKTTKERNELHEKEHLTDEEGMRIGDLEVEFAELNGYEAEAEAATLLKGLGINDELHVKKMKELNDNDKVKVLLAQALFGNPDVLLLDEPTNHLDITSIHWLEEFLLNYKNTVIVVSHDRHFLNKVCSHIVDIDFQKLTLFVGNYDFWKESSELALKLKSDQNKKKEDKIKDLQSFIQRFSSNASKASQATARKKQLDKLTLEDIRPSTRKYPYIKFDQQREVGNDLLFVEGINKSIEGDVLINNMHTTINKGDKIALLGKNDSAKTAFFQILNEEIKPDSGHIKWGGTTIKAYLPKNNASFFEHVELNLVDWLRQFSEEKGEEFIRSFLGRMLFTGEDTQKKVNVLSGGEKMRCILSMMMLKKANVVLFDGPTDHLDLESISSLNTAISSFPGTVIMATHDQNLIESTANRIIEFTPEGVIDQTSPYEEYINNKDLQKKIASMYEGKNG